MMSFRFNSDIAGTPCIIVVEDYRPGAPGDDDHPPEGAEIDYRVLDKDGNPAPWLQDKMDSDDNDRLYEEAFLAMTPPDAGDDRSEDWNDD